MDPSSSKDVPVLPAEAQEQDAFERWKTQMLALFSKRAGCRWLCEICLKFIWNTLAKDQCDTRDQTHEHWDSLQSLINSSESCALCSLMWDSLDCSPKSLESRGFYLSEQFYSVALKFQGTRLDTVEAMLLERKSLGEGICTLSLNF
jgi:hypothetical protein